MSRFIKGMDLSTLLELERCGFVVQTAHHEVGPGQQEINFKYRCGNAYVWEED